ncbi:hypothetical protein D7X55_21230 [Corallococcus sp. AB049A]|uniref:Uncharacterized protein n=1 Tax=Corallococcus interemptor TaxID=2316720 RepID=A0A3A8QTI4_9BACT|nr:MULTISPECIES: hypothetical protein [Corallococcus]RKH42257.1 hypothetical protein D7Y23_31645 [Corallococcus sp. AB050B]RKH71847.1 hypothetical protein D7X96_06870 [Corallococcus interemptor]RKI63063.1 hypothetical protein D7X55_21230 [Corallococcus sp. AB049A]
MKNLTGALVFSTLLSLAVGCHKNTGESPDAATQTGTVQEELKSGREAAPPPEATAEAGTPTESGSPKDASAVNYDSGASDRLALEACVDGWLKAHNLDRYGNSKGTMYAGGTPLFDERTGQSTDRLDYVLQRQPSAKKACVDEGAPK